MKKLLWFTVFWVIPLYADQPRNPFPTTPDQIWQNDLDLSDAISQITQASTATATINCATVTCAGSIYNGPNQLVQTDGNGAIKLSSGTINNFTFQNTTLFDSGFQVFPIVQIQNYTTTTSSSITSGTFTNTHLSGSFTPKFSSSKVLIWVNGDFGQTGGATVGYMTIARNGINLAPTSGGFVLTVANNFSASMLVYDLPSTTSAVTYSVQIRTNGGGTAIFPITDGGAFTSTAEMIVAEIAQ